MNIHLLMKDFLKIDGATVGAASKQSLALLEELLLECDFLEKDKDYVEFLRHYGGAFVAWPNRDLIIDIFGLTDASTNIMGGEYDELVDPDGYFSIASIAIRTGEGQDIYKDFVYLGFSFDATGQRHSGIYKHSWNSRQTEWHYPTFPKWLEEVIIKRGRLF